MKRLWSWLNPPVPVRIYATHAEAMALCGAGYEDPDLVKVVAEKTARIVSGQCPCPPLTPTEMAVALVMLSDEDSPLVLDIGGACGLHHFKLFKLGCRTAWHLVETPAMLQAALFVPRLAKLKIGECWDRYADLILLSGSLQYAPDPLALARRVADTGSECIIVSRLPLTDSSTRIEIQRSMLSENGPLPGLPIGMADREIRYPRTILNRCQFMDAFEPRYRPVLHWSEGPRDGDGFIFQRKDTELTP